MQLLRYPPPHPLTSICLTSPCPAKIIEPIQSRCAILRYAKLSDAELLARLQQIAHAEKVTVTEDGLQALLFTAAGDMRQAINALQATHAGFGLVNGTAPSFVFCGASLTVMVCSGQRVRGV